MGISNQREICLVCKFLAFLFFFFINKTIFYVCSQTLTQPHCHISFYSTPTTEPRNMEFSDSRSMVDVLRHPRSTHKNHSSPCKCTVNGRFPTPLLEPRFHLPLSAARQQANAVHRLVDGGRLLHLQRIHANKILARRVPS